MADDKGFVWHCRRMGGTDQVTLETITELRHLRELDPKLWGALSCPATGLEFDARTLELLDADGDGRIRVPEVLGAVEWLCARVNDAADIKGAPQAMPVSVIKTEDEAGQRLATTAKTLLASKESGGEGLLTPAMLKEAVASAAGQSFNGDGVLPPMDVLDEDVRTFIETGLKVVGGKKDAGGDAGLDKALAQSFHDELAAWKAWRADVARAPHPVPETEAAWDALNAIRERVDDFFLRCRLAAFAPGSDVPLNAEDRLAAVVDKADIDTEMLHSLPLAHVESGAELPLDNGVNPVWHAKVRRFAELVRPLLPSAASMSEAAWQDVCAAFAPYGDAIAARPAVKGYQDGAFAAPDDPAAAIDALGDAGVDRLLTGGVYERFLALCDQDLANAAAEDDIRELERLVLYYCHLHRLLMNFVSFHDFYSLRADVTFRAGTLYMDGRSCELCMPVADVEGHSKLASMSQLCLLYCLCTRRAEDGTVTGTRTIMAALTAGSDDVLVEGRNGVFVDNTGADWDATLLKVVHNPISFRQAMWAPYKRISQMIGQAVAKFAADKSVQDLGSLKKSAADAAQGKAPAAPFDISKGAGIFAAVGLALGAIGTAVGSIAHALFELSWWQFPLLLAGIFIIISGPSVFLAWLKFRKRTLGPVLEASGWAVNTQLPINLKLGSALTRISKQPDNMERPSVLDPFREEDQPHTGLWITLGLVIAALALGGWLWMSGRLTQYVGDLADSLRGVVTTQAPAKADAAKSDAAKTTNTKENDAKAGKADAKGQKPAPAPEKKESAGQGASKPSADKADDGTKPDAAAPKGEKK